MASLLQELHATYSVTPRCDGGVLSQHRFGMPFALSPLFCWCVIALQQRLNGRLSASLQVHEQLVLAGLEAQQAQRRSEADMLELRPAHSNAEWCSTAQPGLALSGFRKGSALLIWNLLVDGQTPDPTAAHVACSPTFGSQVGN